MGRLVLLAAIGSIASGRWTLANRVVRPHVSSLVVQYLNARMPDALPSTKRQDRERQIVVARVGGPSFSPAHEKAMVTIQAWSTKTNADAERLALEARSWIEVMDEPQCWYGHEVGGVTDYPDGTVGTHRYQFTVSLTTKGAHA